MASSWVAKIKAMGNRLNTLEDLLVEQVRELYDVEEQLVDALEEMSDAASTPQLKRAFQAHKQRTVEQKRRLEQVFGKLGQKPQTSRSDGIRGLIADGKVIIESEGDAAVKDAALIAAAQAVEHFEMAGYGSARTFARECGFEDIAELLQQTLDEEGEADQKLIDIAVSRVNPTAARR